MVLKIHVFVRIIFARFNVDCKRKDKEVVTNYDPSREWPPKKKTIICIEVRRLADQQEPFAARTFNQQDKYQRKRAKLPQVLAGG